MVFQRTDKRNLAVVLVDYIGNCLEKVDELIEKLGGAGDEAGDFEEARLETRQGAELVVANAERLIDVRGKSRI